MKMILVAGSILAAAFLVQLWAYLESDKNNTEDLIAEEKMEPKVQENLPQAKEPKTVKIIKEKSGSPTDKGTIALSAVLPEESIAVASNHETAPLARRETVQLPTYKTEEVEYEISKIVEEFQLNDTNSVVYSNKTECNENNCNIELEVENQEATFATNLMLKFKDMGFAPKITDFSRAAIGQKIVLELDISEFKIKEI